jgi:hypothetical protein
VLEVRLQNLPCCQASWYPGERVRPNFVVVECKYLASQTTTHAHMIESASNLAHTLLTAPVIRVQVPKLTQALVVEMSIDWSSPDGPDAVGVISQPSLCATANAEARAPHPTRPPTVLSSSAGTTCKQQPSAVHCCWPLRCTSRYRRTKNHAIARQPRSYSPARAHLCQRSTQLVTLCATIP